LLLQDFVMRDFVMQNFVCEIFTGYRSNSAANAVLMQLPLTADQMPAVAEFAVQLHVGLPE
jgi:hypothetical protein